MEESAWTNALEELRAMYVPQAHHSLVLGEHHALWSGLTNLCHFLTNDKSN
jgi:hypothetical protein